VSLLTDTDIRKILKIEQVESSEDSLTILPYLESSLTPVGYDLRIGKIISTSNKPGRKTIGEGDSFIISPGSTALITTLESIEMPKTRLISGLIESKVTKVAQGLSHISTTVDPDWKGNLLVAIHNHSNKKIELAYGEAFCTIIFIKNLSPSTMLCDKQPGREDIFLDKFDKEANEAENRRKFQEFLPIFIIVITSAIGYYFFGNNTGFSASVAIGVAISQYVTAKFK
jgi:deoxycytidine triphosphate deaminase